MSLTEQQDQAGLPAGAYARASQNTSTKLINAARQLAESGELVSVPDAGAAGSVPG